MAGIWILLALGLALVFALLVIYRIVFYSPGRNRDANWENIPRGRQYDARREKMLALIHSQAAQPCEDVCITTRDGLRLTGRYYHVRDGAPLEIEFHGYRGHAIRDFCGGNHLARAQGRNVLLVDQRAHGRSQGHTIAFGVLERYDCLEWVQAAVRRFGPDTRILLTGVSMGAATVLMASELPLGPNVMGIVADCPYSSPEAIIASVARKRGLPPRLCMPLVRLSARLFGHFRLNASSAVKAVRHTDLPILLIHGEDDHFVPCEMSREIAAAGRNVRLVTVPGAGHAMSYLVDPDRYAEAVRAFTAEIFQ